MNNVETDQPPKAEQKVTKKWEVQKFLTGYAPILMETVEGQEPKPARSAGVVRADIEGSDIAAIVRVCNRFGFGVAQLVDECRMAESHRLAEKECERLNSELDK